MAPVDEADHLLVRVRPVVPVTEPRGPDVVIGQEVRERLDVVRAEGRQDKAAGGRVERRQGAGKAKSMSGPALRGVLQSGWAQPAKAPRGRPRGEQMSFQRCRQGYGQ